jgi:two-component system phosphate regulon sensor histidine kinase PhoR
VLTSPFFRRLFLPYLLLICAATAAVGFFAARTVHATYIERQTEALRQNLRLVCHAIAPQISTPTPAAGASAKAAAPLLDAQVKQMGAAINTRITIMRDDGVVIADSEADPARMENHRNRPEFQQALDRGEGVSSRPSGTIHTDLLYLAQPVEDLAGKPIVGPSGEHYYARLAVHLDQLHRNLNVLYAALSTAALIAIAAAGVICFYFARRHTAPISDLTHFADALSRGDLARRAYRDEKGEIATLATSLNTMAESLSSLIDQTNKDKAELLTILSSMSEGVIATDTRQRLLIVNEAAGKLLGFETSAAVGKALFEVVRNDQVIKAAGDVLARSQRKLISVGPLSARHLDVTLCPFPTQGEPQGLVIVAHDITQSFQYQELRKEFVANVSHELRTPLSVIKGFVETLQDGAWQDARKAPEYLNTIHRHTDQLTNLVSDLLELSKLESQAAATAGGARTGPVDLGYVIRKSQELLAPAVEKKHQTLNVDLSADLPEVKGNADYIERAVANLIDNASKYTPEGGRIQVTAKANGTSVSIEVADNGIGIPRDDLPRIFERFYRVDRSRSREMGGTGLGLSIVKHVAQVHGGQIDVDSTPGKGSTFRLRLPVG